MGVPARRDIRPPHSRASLTAKPQLIGRPHRLDEPDRLHIQYELNNITHRASNPLPPNAVLPKIGQAPLRYDLAVIASVFDPSAIVDAVRRSFVQHWNGAFHQPPPVHLRLPAGDCHIKSGYSEGGENFVIKIATGFHDNPQLGLPGSNGMLIVLSQRTGLPVAVFEDRGLMTAWRTAAATIVAAVAGDLSGALRIGIVGAGLQAELAARWLPTFCNVERIAIWGRTLSRAREVASSINADVCVEGDLETLCRTSNLIITATPASEPLIMSSWIQPGTHIVAVGADNPGKCEIDPELFSRCETVLTDDHAQCLDHGDFGEAVRRGLIDENGDTPIGQVLEGKLKARTCPEAITIADLTGLAVQDDAIVQLFMKRLADPTKPTEFPGRWSADGCLPDC